MYLFRYSAITSFFYFCLLSAISTKTGKSFWRTTHVNDSPNHFSFFHKVYSFLLGLKGLGSQEMSEPRKFIFSCILVTPVNILSFFFFFPNGMIHLLKHLAHVQDCDLFDDVHNSVISNPYNTKSIVKRQRCFRIYTFLFFLPLDENLISDYCLFLFFIWGAKRIYNCRSFLVWFLA